MIDYSVRSGVIIKTPLNKELEVWIPITNNGDVLTQDEYWGEYGLI